MNTNGDAFLLLLQRACTLAGAGLACGLLNAPALAQNLLTNGDFETPAAGPSFTSRSGAGLTGWSINGAIDHIGGFWAAASGVQSVDMNSSSAASISQAVTTTTQARYRLRYALAENFFGFADKTMNVRWNGAVVQSVVVTHDPQRTTTDMRWIEQTLTLSATGPTSTLGFESTTGAMPGSQGVAALYGPAIDNVRLEHITCPADFNQDGTLDPDDLADYIGAFFAVPPGAGSDFNNDGTTDPDDLADFISAFFAGCP